VVFIGVGDVGAGGGQVLPAHPPPKKIGQNHVKFKHFVNFSCRYFPAKCLAPQSQSINQSINQSIFIVKTELTECSRVTIKLEKDKL